MKIREKIKGGKLVTIIRERSRIKICGDFFVYPEEKIDELEEVLNKKSAKEAVEQVLENATLIGISKEDLIRLIERVK